MSSTGQNAADTTSGSTIDSNTVPVTNHSGSGSNTGSSSSSSSTPSSHNAANTSHTTPTTGDNSSTAPGTVDSTAGGTTSQGTTGDGTSGTTPSDTTGHSANGAGTPQAVLSSSSSSIPLSTSTSSSSTSHLPSSTSSSPTATSTSTSSSALPTSTSSSSVPTPTTAPSSTATSTHSTVVSTSTDHLGSVVVITQTLAPTSTALPGVPAKTGGSDLDTGPNIGAIIGGIAGGLVGVILLTYLILIPIRKRAALKKEVDWMAFGSENDHHNNDSGNDSIYRTPRAGVGEVETKVIESPELYQMSDIGSGVHQGTLYSHLDGNASVPSTLPTAWAASGGASGGYNVANQVVGEMPPGQYDQAYGAYYHPAMAVQQQQQQHQQYGTHPSYSDHGSPETGPQRYVGQQHPWPVTTTKSDHSHHQQHSPVNNYPFAPPIPVNGGPVLAAGIQRNYSANGGSQLSRDNHSMSASTVTACDVNGLMRTTSGHANLPPRAPMPGLQPPPPPPAPKTSIKLDNSDDCALAYVLDETNDSPTLDKGAIPGLHLANPDR